MQLRIIAALFIFIGSYLPLALILLAQDFNYDYLYKDFCLNVLSDAKHCVLPLKSPYLSIGMLIICFTCFLISILVLSITRTKRSITITSSKYIPSDLMNYTLPYVVSFMSVGYQDTGKFVGVIIFLGWMFWITQKSGQVILNPLLIVFGWRPYEITYTISVDVNEKSTIALSKEKISAGNVYKYKTIQDVMILENGKNG